MSFEERTGSVSSSGIAMTVAERRENRAPALRVALLRVRPAREQRRQRGGMPGFRGQGQNTIDIETMKRFYIGEVRNLQVRCDFLNGFNHPQFALPNQSLSGGSPGQITGTSVSPRIIQLALKYSF